MSANLVSRLLSFLKSFILRIRTKVSPVDNKASAKILDLQWCSLQSLFRIQNQYDCFIPCWQLQFGGSTRWVTNLVSFGSVHQLGKSSSTIPENSDIVHPEESLPSEQCGPAMLQSTAAIWESHTIRLRYKVTYQLGKSGKLSGRFHLHLWHWETKEALDERFVANLRIRRTCQICQNLPKIPGKRLERVLSVTKTCQLFWRTSAKIPYFGTHMLGVRTL